MQYRDNAILAAFVDYWNLKRGGREMPGRQDIDPAEIPQLLPHVTLIDVIDGGARFRYRLVGTAVVDGFNRNHTGRYVDELEIPQFGRDAFLLQYRSVLRKRRPIYLRNIYVMAGGSQAVTPRVLAPLSRDGKEIDMIMSALVFEFGSARREAIPLRDDTDASLGDAAVL
jgi:hypothetical protein